MGDVRVIEVRQSVFENNEREADKVREKLKASGTFLMNLMGSPGSGKTTLLEALFPYLKKEFSIAVMEADIDSDIDARRIIGSAVEAIQIHTGGMCHLDAGMVQEGLDAVCASRFDIVFLENVGNLVCPAEFDTGAVKNAAVLSVPEGSDKPLKYPLMFEKADYLIVSKIDAAGYFDFDMDALEEAARMRNPDIEIFFVSAKTGEGVEAFARRISEDVRGWKADS